MSKSVVVVNEVKFEIFKSLISSGNYGPYYEQHSISSAIEDTNTAYDKLIIAGVVGEVEDELPDEIGG